MRQTKLMLAFLAILALAATSCAKLQARDNLIKGQAAFKNAHYEDAIRALFADEPGRFKQLIAEWPTDVRDHAARLAERAFDREPQARTG